MLSLIFWTMTVIVSLKYVLLILRADNNGEGGLIAMLALATQAVKDQPPLRRALLVVGIFGTALFYGDGVITPAISVLSAVEGLEVVAPALHALGDPADAGRADRAVRRAALGTGGIGKAFGPITLVWFVVLVAARAAAHRAPTPRCWRRSTRTTRCASSSQHRVHRRSSMLGAVVLCVTGGEALYADLGHFGKLPIRIAWFGLVMPALVHQLLRPGRAAAGATRRR